MILPVRTINSLKNLEKMIVYISTLSPVMDMCIVEIGAWVGVSTRLFSQYFINVIAVDAWENGLGDLGKYDMSEVEKQFDVNTKGRKNIVKIKARSLDAVKTFADRSIDAVYIDASRDYQSVKNDIVAWLPKLRAGGFLCGHDYSSTKFPGVVKAVNEHKRPDRIFPDTSWVVRV